MQLQPSLLLCFGITGLLHVSFPPSFAKSVGITDEEDTVLRHDAALADFPLSLVPKMSSLHLPRHDTEFVQKPIEQSLGMAERFRLAEDITAPPSFTPTAFINPASTLVDKFSYVGLGYCVDDLFQWYSWVESAYQPPGTKDTYCLEWCSENLHTDLVGVVVYRDTYGVICLCNFSGGVPATIHISDYSPAAYSENYEYGVGAIIEANGSSNAVCYRYDNCIRSYRASSVKIEIRTGMIHMFEVKVYSSGNNIAAGKSSSQSSTMDDFVASLAVDGEVNTFSHTNVATSGGPVWWEVNLGNEFPIESVTVINRWCGSPADPNGCLCRLSFATFFLIDSEGVVVATQSTGDTCGKQELSIGKYFAPALES